MVTSGEELVMEKGAGKGNGEHRGRLAALKAVAGMVALGAAYAVFNHRISERDRRTHGWGGRRR
jgi:hypothetical protein